MLGGKGVNEVGCVVNFMIGDIIRLNYKINRIL